MAAQVSKMGAGSLAQPKHGQLCLHLNTGGPALCQPHKVSACPGLLLQWGPGHPEGTRQPGGGTGISSAHRRGPKGARRSWRS